jgi:hypothetical protein
MAPSCILEFSIEYFAYHLQFFADRFVTEFGRDVTFGGDLFIKINVYAICLFQGQEHIFYRRLFKGEGLRFNRQTNQDRFCLHLFL